MNQFPGFIAQHQEGNRLIIEYNDDGTTMYAVPLLGSSYYAVATLAAARLFCAALDN